MHYAVRVTRYLMLSALSFSLHGADKESKQLAADQAQVQTQVIDVTALITTINHLKEELQILTRKHGALSQVVMGISADVNGMKARAPHNQGQVYVPVYAMAMPAPDYEQPRIAHLKGKSNHALCTQQAAQSEYQPQAYVRSYQHSGKSPAPVLSQPEQY